MIEMRWLQRKEKYIECTRIVTTLQFRESTNDYEIANEMEYMPNWTEWADVPTEREGE